VIKGKPPRLGRIFVSSPRYFVTFCTLHRRALLANNEIHENFRRYYLDAYDHDVAVGRYVIMPNHIHLFVCGGLEFRLGVWVRGLKRAISLGRNAWQPGFFDHILRSDESYSQKWEYVKENPVRANLVKRSDDWFFQGDISLIDRA
jgi:putative transposase